MLPALKRLYKENGTLGVIEWIYDKKRFWFAKVFLKTIFKILPYEWILRVVSNFDISIPKLGYHTAILKFIDALNIKINTEKKVQIEGGALLFGNHPTGLDPYILASCIERNDIYIVADIYQQEKGKNIGEHIIPIVYSADPNNLANREFLNKIGFFIMRQFSGYEKKDTVKELNKKAVCAAVQHLQEGHVVIIFPDGGSNNPEFWYNGIGEVIKATTSGSESLNMYAAQINGISSAKLWKHFLFNRLEYLFKNPVNIKISQMFTPESLYISKDEQSKDITEKLRTIFINNTLWNAPYAYSKK